MEPIFTLVCFFLGYYMGTDYDNYCKAKRRHEEMVDKLNSIESRLSSIESRIK
jgi:hypothetical protein